MSQAENKPNSELERIPVVWKRSRRVGKAKRAHQSRARWARREERAFAHPTRRVNFIGTCSSRSMPSRVGKAKRAHVGPSRVGTARRARLCPPYGLRVHRSLR